MANALDTQAEAYYNTSITLFQYLIEVAIVSQIGYSNH